MLALRPQVEPKLVATADSVVVKELYLSLQGESSHQGLLCAFVRLTGCHLRCSYCDSEFAFRGGERRKNSDVLAEVLAMIDSGYFTPGNVADAKSIVDRLTSDGEPYYVLADYRAYLEAQDRADALYLMPDAWSRSAVVNCVNMGYFSSDRSIREYADKIWNIRPVI